MTAVVACERWPLILLSLDDTDRPKQLAALDCTAQISFPRPVGDRWIYSILVNCCRSTHRPL